MGGLSRKHRWAWACTETLREAEKSILTLNGALVHVAGGWQQGGSWNMAGLDGMGVVNKSGFGHGVGAW